MLKRFFIGFAGDDDMRNKCGVVDCGTGDSGARPLKKRVTLATGEVLNLISAGKAYAKEDPERFYAEVESLLRPLIDFPRFARNVMGPFARVGYSGSASAVCRFVQMEFGAYLCVGFDRIWWRQGCSCPAAQSAQESR